MMWPQLYPAGHSGHLWNKLRFETNFPQLPLERRVSEARALELDPDVDRTLLAANARRIFGLG